MPEKVKEFAQVMREFGISRLKVDGIEIVIPSHHVQTNPEAPSLPSPLIDHKVEELTSLLKLNDSDLVDQLFPLPKDTE